MRMWLISLGLFLTVSARREEYDRIGYFWQITDIHYDPHFTIHGDFKKGCWRSEHASNSPSNRNGNKGQTKTSNENLGKYGEYNCDSTWELIESAAKFMKSRPNDNVEFVLWTGWLDGKLLQHRQVSSRGLSAPDKNILILTGNGISLAQQVRTANSIRLVQRVLTGNSINWIQHYVNDGLSHFATRHLSENHQMELVQALTDLLGKTFPAQFVFPALGHDDPPFKKHLGRMWSRWLPTDSMKTFEIGGYYIIERKQLKLQLVVLNTNLMKRSEMDEDAAQQWNWLEQVLYKFQKSGETVYLVGHVAPGWDERQKGLFQPAHGAYTDYHNRKYIDLVRNFSDIIVGQFFGHLHSDSYRIIYEKNGRPISWAMIAPSITPKRKHLGANNPGLRLYKFNKDTGQIFDYTQYYMDLSQGNSQAKAEWVVEYNFTTYYGLNEISADSLHHLTRKFVNYGQGFERYYRANTVKVVSHPRDHCDLSCVHNHYCVITQLDYDALEDCLIRTAMIRSVAQRKFYHSSIVMVMFCYYFV